MLVAHELDSDALLATECLVREATVKRERSIGAELSS